MMPGSWVRHEKVWAARKRPLQTLRTGTATVLDSEPSTRPERPLGFGAFAPVGEWEYVGRLDNRTPSV